MRVLAETDPCSGGLDKFEVSGHEVGVEVGVDDPFDRQTVLGRIVRGTRRCRAGGPQRLRGRWFRHRSGTTRVTGTRCSTARESSSLPCYSGGASPSLHIPLWVCQVPYGVYLFRSCRYPHGYAIMRSNDTPGGISDQVIGRLNDHTNSRHDRFGRPAESVGVPDAATHTRRPYAGGVRVGSYSRCVQRSARSAAGAPRRDSRARR